jgi:signal peptidase I
MRRKVAVALVVAVLAVGTAVAAGVVVLRRVPRPRAFVVASAAMEPSLAKNDRMLCTTRVPKRLRRGSVITFHAPEGAALSEEGTTFVKRVVGLPGETIAGDENGTVAINGVALAEPYARTERSLAFGPVTVPEGAYFLLGDNRARSSDSRAQGPVPHAEVTGVCTRILAPASRRGRIPGT